MVCESRDLLPPCPGSVRTHGVVPDHIQRVSSGEKVEAVPEDHEGRGFTCASPHTVGPRRPCA